MPFNSSHTAAEPQTVVSSPPAEMSPNPSPTAGESQTVPPAAAAVNVFTPLHTTPSVAAMNNNLLRHLLPYVDSLAPLQQVTTQAAVEEDEEKEEEEGKGEEMETDGETEEGEDLDRRDPTPPAPAPAPAPAPRHVPSNGEGRAMPQEALRSPAPPLPPRPATVVAPPAPAPEPKNKLPSFKIRIPERIWNEVTIEMQLKRLEEAKAAVAAAEATAAAAVATTTTTPKKGTKRAHFETVLLVPNTNPVDQAEAEEEQEEDSRPRHRRRIDSSPGAEQSSRPLEATSSLNAGTAPKRSSGIPRAAASSSKQTPAPNPYARRYSARATRSAGPVAPPAAPTPVSAAALPSALALAEAVAAAATRPLTIEGPRTAWRRLFPQLGCEMSDYKGVPDAWHELMLWDGETRCWRARRPDEVYVKKVLGGTQVLRAWHQKTWGLESPMRKEWNRRRREILEQREVSGVDGENVEGSGESSRAGENGSGDAQGEDRAV